MLWWVLISIDTLIMWWFLLCSTMGGLEALGYLGIILCCLELAIIVILYKRKH